MKLRGYFEREVEIAAVVLAVLLAVSTGTYTVTVVHRARAAERRVCAAELRYERARYEAKPHGLVLLLPADPCDALAELRGAPFFTTERRSP